MTLKSFTAEAGSNGTGVTTSDASPDTLSVVSPGSGGTINYTNSPIWHGFLSITSTQATGANLCYVAMDDSSATAFSVGFFFYMTGLPDAEAQFPVGVRSSTDTHVLRLQMTTTGLIRIVGGATLGTSAVTLSTATWYWITWTGSGLNGASGTSTYKLYSISSGTALDTLTVSSFTTSSTITRVRYGKGSSANIAAWTYDDIRQNLGTSTEITRPANVLTFTDSAGISDAGVGSGHTYTFTDAVGVTDSVTTTLTSFSLLPLSLKYELLIGGVWTDITTYVYQREATTITRGRANESSTASSASCTFLVNNRDGRFSPSNPVGPWFGQFGRNTEVRVSVAGNYRFWGVVSDFPTTWDTSARDVVTSIVCNDVFRRAGQGGKQAKSAYNFACTSVVSPLSHLVSYWPCEDGKYATQVSTQYPGGTPLQFVNGNPNLANDSTSFVCSAPLLTLGTTAALAGPVTRYADTGMIQFRFLINIPAGSIPSTTRICTLLCGGTVTRWEIRSNNVGTLTVDAFDTSGANVLHDTSATFGVIGKAFRLSLAMGNSGSDVNYSLSILQPGQTTGLDIGGTVTGQSIGAATWVAINPDYSLAGITIGHITVQAQITSSFDLSDALFAYFGETAGIRLSRLCGQKGYVFSLLGDPTLTSPMGYQLTNTMIGLMQECEATDGGLLYTRRSNLAVGYRTRENLEYQTPALVLDFPSADFSTFAPTQDDQFVTNDVTASSSAGASGRYTLNSGALSIQDPPNGIGTYDTSATINTAYDVQLTDIAAWMVHRGTYPGYRYPSILINMLRTNFINNSTKLNQAIAVNIGDVLSITNPPSTQMPPDSINQIVVGYTETLNAFSWKIAFVGTPAEPWNTGSYDDGICKYDGETTTVAVPLSRQKAEFTGSQALSYSGINASADLDVRVQLSLTDWTPATEQSFIAKYQNTGNQRSWAFDVTTAGDLHVYLSADGSTNVQATSTAATGFTDGTTHWVRFTLDANNGAGGYTVKFYTSSDGYSWTQLGTSVTGGSPISIFPSTALYQLGSRSGTSLTSSISGTVYTAEVLDGIGAVFSNLVPFDPEDWTDGYSGSGTGASRTAQTTSQLTITDSNSLCYWTHADGDYDISITGERMTVTAVSGSSWPQTMTVTRAVNGVLKFHLLGEALGLWSPIYYDIAL